MVWVTRYMHLFKTHGMVHLRFVRVIVCKFHSKRGKKSLKKYLKEVLFYIQQTGNAVGHPDPSDPH